MNPARDLLNFVDEHKEEMKDNTYKNIVDKLKNINDNFDNNDRFKCEVTFNIQKPVFDREDPDDVSIDVVDGRKTFNIYLNQDEYDIIYNKIDQVFQIYTFNDEQVSQHRGINLIQQLLDQFSDRFCRERFIFKCRQHNGQVDFVIEYHINASVVRIKKSGL